MSSSRDILDSTPGDVNMESVNNYPPRPTSVSVNGSFHAQMGVDMESVPQYPPCRIETPVSINSLATYILFLTDRCRRPSELDPQDLRRHILSNVMTVCEPQPYKMRC
jgi:hypothetical protein